MEVKIKTTKINKDNRGYLIAIIILQAFIIGLLFMEFYFDIFDNKVENRVEEIQPYHT